MPRKLVDVFAMWAALAAASASVVVHNSSVEASDEIQQYPYFDRLQKNDTDVCSFASEENRTGKIYVEFIGQPDLLTEDDVVEVRGSLIDAYAQASREECMDGFRSMYAVEVDQNITLSPQAVGQFRVYMNVMVKCKGCSEDLRFFSSSDGGRSQTRFLEAHLTRNVKERDFFGSFFDEKRRGRKEQEPFLYDRGCLCPPPPRDRIIQLIRDRIKSRKDHGNRTSISDIATVGAYALSSENDKESEIEATDTSFEPNASCTIRPPFSSPIALADAEVFNVLSVCPFLLHEQISGLPSNGCFPMYAVPNWNSPSVSFTINPLQGGPALFFEKDQPSLVGWEDLLASHPGDPGELKSCIDQLGFEAVAVKGDVSGENGTTSWFTVVVSVTEQEQKKYIMLPFGGCEDDIAEGHGRFVQQRGQSTSVSVESDGRISPTNSTLQNPIYGCSIRPDDLHGAEWNDCLEICYTISESAFNAEVENLAPFRDDRLMKNRNNEGAIIQKMFLSRGSQVALAFARCKCTIITSDELGSCLLEAYLDIVASEADLGFEAEEIFGQHMFLVQNWYDTSVQHSCVAAIGRALGCHATCASGE